LLQADIQGCSTAASFSAVVFIFLRHLTRPSDARHTRKCSFGDGAALCMGHLFARGHHTSAYYLRTALPAEPGHLPTPTPTLTAGFPRNPGAAGPWIQGNDHPIGNGIFLSKAVGLFLMFYSHFFHKNRNVFSKRKHPYSKSVIFNGFSDFISWE